MNTITRKTLWSVTFAVLGAGTRTVYFDNYKTAKEFSEITQYSDNPVMHTFSEKTASKIHFYNTVEEFNNELNY